MAEISELRAKKPEAVEWMINSSTEISLPVCALVLGCMVMGIWHIYSTAFIVDPTMAMVLIQTGANFVQKITEGVYVL